MGASTNTISGILSSFASAPWLGSTLYTGSNTMGAQGLADHLCLFGNRLRMWLSGHSALNTVVDWAGVIQEGKLEGWSTVR